MSQDSDVLTYLAELDIHPGSRIRMVEREPVGGLLHVDIAGTARVISKDLALLIRGEVSA